MASYPRGVINPPNKPGKAGDLAHSSGGLSSQPPGTHAANDQRSAPIGSSASLGRSHGAVHGSNDSAKFDVSRAHEGYTNTGVVAPGRGAVPIEPDQRSALSGGSVQGASILRDTAKR